MPELSRAGSQLTTFGVGGAVSLYEPDSFTSLGNLIQAVRDKGRSFRVLGAGSNVVISDDGISDAVIRLGRNFTQCGVARENYSAITDLEEIEDGWEHAPGEGESLRLIACGGVSLMSLSRKTAARGLAGLEFAAGIPASLGGAVVMNAGAHGSCMSEVVTRIYVIDAQRGFRALEKQELNFSYRHCVLPAGSIVLAAEIELRPGNTAEISARRAECLKYRKRTQPLHLPSAGSVFRNPPGAGDGGAPFAAQLLERVGIKGLRQGGVQFSPQHANWLVKVSDSATASDVSHLVELAQQRVRDETGVELVPEIIFWS